MPECPFKSSPRACGTTGKYTARGVAQSDEHRLLTDDGLLHLASLAARRNGDHFGDHLPEKDVISNDD